MGEKKMDNDDINMSVKSRSPKLRKEQVSYRVHTRIVASSKMEAPTT